MERQEEELLAKQLRGIKAPQSSSGLVGVAFAVRHPSVTARLRQTTR